MLALLDGFNVVSFWGLFRIALVLSRARYCSAVFAQGVFVIDAC